MDIKSENLWIDKVIGSRRISNFIWASVVFLGSVGFILVGLSSYIGKDIIPLLPSQSISFAPQGLVMLF